MSLCQYYGTATRRLSCYTSSTPCGLSFRKVSTTSSSPDATFPKPCCRGAEYEKSVFFWLRAVDAFRTLDWRKIQQELEFSGVLSLPYQSKINHVQLL